VRIQTHLNVAKAPPGRHNAGPGLYLIVSKDGRNRRWAFRYTKPNSRRVTEHGLGSTTLLSLAEARNKAHDYRRAVAHGKDPIEDKRDARRNQIMFAEIANAYIAVKSPGWRAKSTYAEMCLLLNTHAGSLATKYIGTITSNDIELAVRDLWSRAPVQGRRTLGAISQVFDYAIACDHCTTNPAEWKIMRHRFPKRTNSKHFAAMDYAKVPEFVQRLREQQRRDEALSPWVIEFLLLTACRSSEVGEMRWSEIDFDNKVWTVPGDRTKSGRVHQVPLCGRAMEILRHQRELGATFVPVGGTFVPVEFVWPGRRGKAPISRKALYLFLTKTMGVEATIHGFRAVFRTWAGNETHYDRVTSELALGHRAGNAVELAYRRGDELAKRRGLMDLWEAYCSGS
jgi:integrase